MTSIFTAREFNQNPNAVERAAANGPVFITKRGINSLVVLSVDEYQKLAGGQKTAYDILMSLPAEGFDIDFEPDKTFSLGARDVDFD